MALGTPLLCLRLLPTDPRLKSRPRAPAPGPRRTTPTSFPASRGHLMPRRGPLRTASPDTDPDSFLIPPPGLCTHCPPCKSLLPCQDHVYPSEPLVTLYRPFITHDLLMSSNELVGTGLPMTGNSLREGPAGPEHGWAAAQLMEVTGSLTWLQN